MKTVSLSGSLRENVGKKDAKQVRKDGNIPCVLYGGTKQIHFAVENLAFGKIIFTPDVFLVTLNLGDESYQGILQDVQYHPVTDSVLHADFLEITPGKPITVALPVQLTGKSPGVLAGGKLNIKLRKLKVRGLIEDLPEYIVVDISKMTLGGSLKVRDLLTDNLQFLDTQNGVVVNVKTARVIVEDGDEDDEDEDEDGEGGEGGEDGETPAES